MGASEPLERFMGMKALTPWHVSASYSAQPSPLSIHWQPSAPFLGGSILAMIWVGALPSVPQADDGVNVCGQSYLSVCVLARSTSRLSSAGSSSKTDKGSAQNNQSNRLEKPMSQWVDARPCITSSKACRVLMHRITQAVLREEFDAMTPEVQGLQGLSPPRF